MFEQNLNVHGIQVRLQTPIEKVCADFAHDFAYFATKEIFPSTRPTFTIRHQTESQEPLGTAGLSSKRRSKHYFALGNRSRLFMFGAAHVSYDFSKKQCAIQCADPDIAYEAVYLTVLSYLGEAGDLKAQHRIHGFGFVSNGVSGILLSPSGGGKSTLAMQLLKMGGHSILSDDTPVVCKNGNMLAFPQRIALKEAPEIPASFSRKFKRFHFGEKFVVGADFFGHAIVNEAPIEWLILSDKKKSEKASIEELNRIELIWPLLKWLVLGYETPQIWELFIRPSISDIYSKTKILFSRIDTAFRILMKVKGARFRFANDPKESAEVFRGFFKDSEQRRGGEWNFQYTS